MNKKDDMIAALSHRQPKGAVPLWELEFQAWDAASGRHLVLGHEFAALSDSDKQRAMEENADILLETSASLNFAALSAPNGFWNQAPGQLAYYCMPGEWRFEQMRVLRKRCPDDLMLVANGASAILVANYSEDFCERMFEDPESLDKLAEERLEKSIELATRLRDCGAEMIFTASDIADNSGPFFNPTQMKRWILPNLHRWSEALHEMGLFAIMHSDGNLMPYINDLAETGLNGIQAIDPIAGMDIADIRKEIGNRLCLCGNVDCGLLLNGTPAEVFTATRSLLELMKSSGAFVLGASNAVQAEVPIENYLAMIEAWRVYGNMETSKPPCSNP